MLCTRRSMRDSLTRCSALFASLLIVVGAPALADSETAASEPAAVPEMARSDEEVLRQRATEYWQARMSRSAKVMEFYAPADKGGPTRAKDVSEFGNVGYSSHSVQDVTVEGDRGIVQIQVTAVFPLPVPRKVAKDILNRTIGEEWLKVDGVWYKRPIPAGFATNRKRPDAASTPPKPASAEGDADSL